MARKGNGVAGFAYTLAGRIAEWNAMKECSMQSHKTKVMKDGNGQCKQAFRRPGSQKKG